MVFPNRTISALKTYYQREYKKEHVEEIEANDNVCQKRPWTTEEEEAFHEGFTTYGTQVRPGVLVAVVFRVHIICESAAPCTLLPRFHDP